MRVCVSVLVYTIARAFVSVCGMRENERVKERERGKRKNERKKDKDRGIDRERKRGTER